MFNVIGGARPRLADVQCSRMRFEPGDRVLVRVYERIEPDALKKLRRSVERWAGDGVEVLIVNGLEMEVEVERPRIISP